MMSSKGIPMKLSLLFVLALTAACEYGTLKHGYYWNPLTVLEKADEAIRRGDEDALAELLSGKTLCTYGNIEGIVNLNKTLKRISSGSLHEPKLVSKNYLSSPQYLGYWSYYQETYFAEGFTSSGKKALSVTLTCDFGSDQKRADLKNAPLSRYGVRSCSITKIVNHLNPIFVPEVCR
jgi:hypothetical protein